MLPIEMHHAWIQAGLILFKWIKVESHIFVFILQQLSVIELLAHCYIVIYCSFPKVLVPDTQKTLRIHPLSLPDIRAVGAQTCEKSNNSLYSVT